MANARQSASSATSNPARLSTTPRCLDILEQEGSMSAGRLAQESRLTTGAITAVIDRLERAGLRARLDER